MASCRAVVSRGAIGGDPNLVFSGSGSAVVVLESDPLDGDLNFFGPLSGARIDVGGLVRELALVGDDLYVAAKRAGLVRLVRTGNTWSEDFRFALPTNGANDQEQAFSLATWEYTVPSGGGSVSGVRVLVGTSDELGGGKLYLIDPNASSPVLDVLTTTGEVWTIAAAEGFVADKFTVLVGTACNGIGRFEFDLDAAAIPSVSGPAVLSSFFVRDIELEAQGSGNGRAFVALNRAGEAILSLNGGGMSLAAGPVQPKLGSPTLTPITYCNGLSYDPVWKRLAVVLGPWFREEKQFGSDERIPIPCTLVPEIDAIDRGVVVYSAVTNSLVEQVWDVTTVESIAKPIPAIEVRVRSGTSSSYFLDLAGGDGGTHSFLAEVDGQGNWTLDRAEEALDQRLLVSLVTTDEVLVQQAALYGANEYSLSAYERTIGLAPPLLVPAAVVVAEPANTITGFPEPHARLYTTGFSGIRIYDASGPNRLAPIPGPSLIPSEGDRGLASRATYGLSPDFITTPRWLVKASFGESDVGLNTGSLQLYDVGLATTGDDPQVRRVSSWLHRGDFPAGFALPNASLRDLAIRPAGNQQYWYVSYGPKPASSEAGQSFAAETHIGLLTLRIRLLPNDRIVIELVDREPIVVAEQGNAPWRVTYDSARSRIYLALASQGVACFDASNAGNPSLLWHRDDFVGPTDIATCYQVLPGPGDSLVVSYLDRGLLVIEDYADPSSDAVFHTTRFQAISIAKDPDDTSGSSFYVGDARAGLVRVTLP